MESVSTLVYCNSDLIPLYEGIKFEYPIYPKVIIISEDMSFDALRKIILDANKGCITLLDHFYCQPIYVSDNYAKYDCIELNHNDGVGKMFFIYLKFNTKGLIEFNATFRLSLDEIFVLLHKRRKPRMTDEMIALMRDEPV